MENSKKTYTIEEVMDMLEKEPSFAERVKDKMKYYCYKPVSAMKGLFTFLSNVRRFRKELWKYRSYDYSYSVTMFTRALTDLRDYIEQYGLENDVTKQKKVAAMTELIMLLESTCLENEAFCDAVDKLAAEKYGDEDKYAGIALAYRDIIDANKKRIAELLNGQSEECFEAAIKNNPDLTWEEWFDGSGIAGWWD